MGTVISTKCEHCDFTFNANIGQGFRGCGFFELDHKTGKPYYYGYIKSQKILADIERIVDTWDVVDEDEDLYHLRREWSGHGSAQYLCSKCGRLHNKFFFALIGTGGKYQPTYYCSTCKGRLTLVELIVGDKRRISIKSEPQVKWKCPNCDSDKLLLNDEFGIICYD